LRFWALGSGVEFRGVQQYRRMVASQPPRLNQSGAIKIQNARPRSGLPRSEYKPDIIHER